MKIKSYYIYNKLNNFLSWTKRELSFPSINNIVLLFAVLMFLVTGCNGDETTNTTTPNEDTAQTAVASQPESENEADTLTSPLKKMDLTIGVSNLSYDHPFTKAMGKGIRELAQELGVELIELDGNYDTIQQTSDIQDLISQEVDGIIIIPIDSNTAVGWVDSINEANIPVVSAGVQVSEGNRDLTDVYPGLVALITQDEIGTGRQSAEAVKQLLPDGGNIAIVEGRAGFAEAIWRSQGFIEVLEEADGFTIVDQLPGDWAEEGGETACRNMLQTHPDIDLFYVQDDSMVIGCQKVVEAENADTLIFGNSSGSKAGVALMAQKKIAGGICFKPATMGKLALRTIVEHLRGEKARQAEFLSYDTIVFNADNLDSCSPEW